MLVTLDEDEITKFARDQKSSTRIRGPDQKEEVIDLLNHVIQRKRIKNWHPMNP